MVILLRATSAPSTLARCSFTAWAIRRTIALLRFFFLQAEDGIRDIGVTGVQTCALPIWSPEASAAIGAPTKNESMTRPVEEQAFRSEERRVGKGVDLGGRRIIKKKIEQNQVSTCFYGRSKRWPRVLLRDIAVPSVSNY